MLECLLGAGFDPTRPAFVGWLGVSMYLGLPAIERVLAAVGTLPPGTELVADHMLPEPDRDEAGNAYVSAVAPNAARRTASRGARSCPQRTPPDPPLGPRPREGWQQ
ncbi:MAG TPA: hypothetical protein VGP26_06565 [Actinophytocola sp.]|nr:hypothetical protein [Actinophytocola sp.]